MVSVRQALRLLMSAVGRSIRWRLSRFKFTSQRAPLKQENSDVAFWLEYWRKKVAEHVQNLSEELHDYRYLELVRTHSSDANWYCHKVLPLFSFALLSKATHIVELGCSFSFYPETYGQAGPWGLSVSHVEGAISTRILLTACRFLNKFGIPSRLTSIDLRISPLFENMKKLLSDLDLVQYWNPVMGTDSITWLQHQTDPIDLGLLIPTTPLTKYPVNWRILHHSCLRMAS